MAISTRQGVLNLFNVSKALSRRSWSDSNFKNNNHVNNKKNAWLSSRVQIPTIRFGISSVFGVRILCTYDNYGSTEIRKCSSKEIRKLNNSNDRFDLIRNCTPGQHETNGQDDSVSRTNAVAVTTMGPVDLSLEPSIRQVSGDLEQENFENASGESFPRAAYQCPPHVEASRAPPARTVTFSKMEFGVMNNLEDALGFPLGQGPQAPFSKPLVIVISGPSGVGKDAVIKGLQKVRQDIHFIVTATTRTMRPNEKDGVDYYFMSRTEFQEMIENHELLEHAIVYGDYKGIPRKQVREFISQGMDVVLRVDVQGAATVRSILGSEAVFIFLVAESELALVKRLIERKTETMDKMLVRVATAREELTHMEEFDYVVVNEEGRLDRTISLISSIIDAEKARVTPKVAEI